MLTAEVCSHSCTIMTEGLLQSYAAQFTELYRGPDIRQRIPQSAFTVTETTMHYASQDSCCNGEVKPSRSIMLKLQLGAEVQVSSRNLLTALQTADSMLKHIHCMHPFLSTAWAHSRLQCQTGAQCIANWAVALHAKSPVGTVCSSCKQFSKKVSAKCFKHSLPDALTCAQLFHVYIASM